MQLFSLFDVPYMAYIINKSVFQQIYLILSIGADYGARTRHLDLGKVALYQMS